MNIELEESPGDKHSWLAKQSHIILYFFTTFWQVNQSNALTYVSGKSNLSAY